MDNVDVERKLVVIQKYLAKSFPQYAVRCDDRATGEPVFVLISSGAVQCRIRVNSALLADRHPTAMELGWALQDNHLAGKVLKTAEFYLDHEAVPERL